ncbi:MAG: tetratricopeptide repeat protein [Phototrophicaceae bacterium]
MRAWRRHFLEQAAQWDATTRVALTVAVLILLAMLALGIWGDGSVRLGASIGAATAFIMAQVVILWGNRQMVTPYTQAQRHYLNAEFEQAAQVLQDALQDTPQSVAMLTLLGNTYRQMGQLTESRRVLYEAVDISQKDYFPAYGLGRTLLVMGEYPQAVALLHSALDLGAPPIVRGDLAEAYYRLGSLEDARHQLQQLPQRLDVEPYRALMLVYLADQLGVAPIAYRGALDEGLPYWENSAVRFADTPYGMALQQELVTIKTFIRGE